MSKEFSSSIEKQDILKDFESYLRKEGQRFNTIRSNRGPVGRFLDWVAHEQIYYLQVSYTDLLAYINYNKKQGNTKSTINKKLLAIKHFYNHLQQSGKVKSNPCEELRIKGIIKRQPHDLLEWEDLEHLYKNYPTSNITGKRNKAIIGMMIYQGLNSGEVASLELNDVNLEEGTIYIPQVSRSNSRILKLESFQVLQLQKYITQVRPVLLALTEKESANLFVSTGDGYRLDNSLVRLMRAARKVNPKVTHPKQIRASVITYWLKTHNIRQVQYMAGHRYISSTEHYRIDLLETLQEQIDQLHPLK